MFLNVKDKDERFTLINTNNIETATVVLEVDDMNGFIVDMSYKIEIKTGAGEFVSNGMGTEPPNFMTRFSREDIQEILNYVLGYVLNNNYDSDYIGSIDSVLLDYVDKIGEDYAINEGFLA